MKALIFLWCCLFLPGIFTYGQVFPYRHYGTKEGLPHSNVFCMEQDEQGFIWFGTENGLSRFDGAQFINYSIKEGLLSNEVTAMTKTSDNKRLLVGLYDQALYYIKQGLIYNISPKKDTRNLFPNLAEIDGVIYSGLLDELREIKGRQVICHGTKPRIGVINCLLANGNTGLLIGTDSGLFAYKKKEFRLLWRGGAVSAVTLDRKGCIWVGVGSNIYQLNKAGDTVLRKISAGTNYTVGRLLIDKSERIWYWASSALSPNKLEMIDGEVIRPVGKQLGIHNLQINCFFEDAQQNLWICTFGKGVYCITNFFVQNYTMENGLSNNYIFSIAKDKDTNIWVGSYKGLTVINKHNQVVKTVHTKHPLVTYRQIYAAPDGDTYLACISNFPGTVYCQKTSGRNIWYCKARSILLVGDTLFLGGWSNTLEYYIRHGKNNFIPGGEVLLFDKPLGYVRINCMFRDHLGQLWIGTNKGLCRISKNLKKVNTYFTEVPEHIYVIKEDITGKLWVGSRKGVVTYFKSVWRTYVPGKQALASATAIDFDQAGYTWIGTLNGLYRCRNNSVQQIGKSQGLLSDNINGLYVDTARQMVWSGSSEGLSAIDLKQTDKEPVAHFPVNISEVFFGGRAFHTFQNLPMVPYNNRNLQFTFSQPAFQNQHEQKYTYWFADDTTQRFITRQPNIQLTSVAPGNYTLFISGHGKHLPPARIDFVVERPFWMTWWFRSLIVSFVFLLVALLVQQRIQKVKVRERSKVLIMEEMNRLRHQALAAMMNPHFIFNALSTVQHFVNRQKKHEANEFLSAFGKLIRANLDVAHRSTISLAEELERLKQYLELEKMRFGDKLQYQIDMDENLSPREIAFPNMLMQPFAENAIKHGILPSNRKGLLHIGFVKTNDTHMQITVDDNGVGLHNGPKAGKHSHLSMGIHVVEERLKLFLKEQYIPVSMQEKQDAEGNITGTRITIQLPLQPLTHL